MEADFSKPILIFVRLEIVYVHRCTDTCFGLPTVCPYAGVRTDRALLPGPYVRYRYASPCVGGSTLTTCAVVGCGLRPPTRFGVGTLAVAAFAVAALAGFAAAFSAARTASTVASNGTLNFTSYQTLFTTTNARFP